MKQVTVLLLAMGSGALLALSGFAIWHHDGPIAVITGAIACVLMLAAAGFAGWLEL